MCAAVQMTMVKTSNNESATRKTTIKLIKLNTGGNETKKNNNNNYVSYAVFTFFHEILEFSRMSNKHLYSKFFLYKNEYFRLIFTRDRNSNFKVCNGLSDKILRCHPDICVVGSTLFPFLHLNFVLPHIYIAETPS